MLETYKGNFLFGAKKVMSNNNYQVLGNVSIVRKYG